MSFTSALQDKINSWDS